jgi:hypothetical protein
MTALRDSQEWPLQLISSSVDNALNSNVGHLTPFLSLDCYASCHTILHIEVFDSFFSQHQRHPLHSHKGETP